MSFLERQSLVIPLLGLVGGIVLLVYGLFRHRLMNRFKTVPCLPIGAVKSDTPLFITGQAHSPGIINSPISKTPCVFYAEKIERMVRNDLSQPVSSYDFHWELDSIDACGGFFVRDNSGTALVVPTPKSLDIAVNASASDDALFAGKYDRNITRRSEQIVQEGSNVTVLGTPCSLNEFMEYMHRNDPLEMPSDLVKELVSLKSNPDAAIPCFFADRVEKVACLSYSDYAAATASAASSLTLTGALITLVSAAFLFLALRNAVPPPWF